MQREVGEGGNAEGGGGGTKSADSAEGGVLQYTTPLN